MFAIKTIVIYVVGIFVNTTNIYQLTNTIDLQNNCLLSREDYTVKALKKKVEEVERESI